mmetsp:Transcript_128165/g.358799  ORF Transcript_128165/g.358799 Transcript_128165/m.358799 type:complete len:275 (-) Transcript_128165:1368-2192(-)
MRREVVAVSVALRRWGRCPRHSAHHLQRLPPRAAGGAPDVSARQVAPALAVLRDVGHARACNGPSLCGLLHDVRRWAHEITCVAAAAVLLRVAVGAEASRNTDHCGRGAVAPLGASAAALPNLRGAIAPVGALHGAPLRSTNNAGATLVAGRRIASRMRALVRADLRGRALGRALRGLRLREALRLRRGDRGGARAALNSVHREEGRLHVVVPHLASRHHGRSPHEGPRGPIACSWISAHRPAGVVDVGIERLLLLLLLTDVALLPLRLLLLPR